MEKAKEKNLQDRKATQAKELTAAHKQELLAQEELKTKERLEAQGKVHDLPSPEFVQTQLIGKLRGHHLIAFQMLFAQIDNDRIMNDQRVLDLAGHFMNSLVQNNIGCAKDFMNNVKVRIHRRHDTDDGDLLPKNYVDILRTVFVIFGIFPKDWNPETKGTQGDRDAMEKYRTRVADAAYWNNKG